MHKVQNLESRLESIENGPAMEELQKQLADAKARYEFSEKVNPTFNSLLLSYFFPVLLTYCTKAQNHYLEEIEQIGKAWQEHEQNSFTKAVKLSEKEDQIMRFLSEVCQNMHSIFFIILIIFSGILVNSHAHMVFES